jgi:hypothetical protein
MSRNLVSRLQIALLVGIILFILTFLSYWNWSRDTLMDNSTLSSQTTISLRRFVKVLEDHIQKRIPLPQSLADISSEIDSTPSFPSRFLPEGLSFIKNGIPVDGWGRPLHYSTEGTSYTLLSYGRDGKPGGIGLDCDEVIIHGPGADYAHFIESPDRYREAPTYMPTLYQFVFELPSKGMIQSCFLTGGLAFFITLFLVRSVPASRREQIFCAIKIVVTIVMSFIFASLILNLHIPTGH